MTIFIKLLPRNHSVHHCRMTPCVIAVPPLMLQQVGQPPVTMRSQILQQILSRDRPIQKTLWVIRQCCHQKSAIVLWLINGSKFNVLWKSSNKYISKERMGKHGHSIHKAHQKILPEAVYYCLIVNRVQTPLLMMPTLNCRIPMRKICLPPNLRYVFRVNI